MDPPAQLSQLPPVDAKVVAPISTDAPNLPKLEEKDAFLYQELTLLWEGVGRDKTKFTTLLDEGHSVELAAIIPFIPVEQMPFETGFAPSQLKFILLTSPYVRSLAFCQRFPDPAVWDAPDTDAFMVRYGSLRAEFCCVIAVQKLLILLGVQNFYIPGQDIEPKARTALCREASMTSKILAVVDPGNLLVKKNHHQQRLRAVANEKLADQVYRLFGVRICFRRMLAHRYKSFAVVTIPSVHAGMIQLAASGHFGGMPDPVPFAEEREQSGPEEEHGSGGGGGGTGPGDAGGHLHRRRSKRKRSRLHGAGGGGAKRRKRHRSRDTLDVERRRTTYGHVLSFDNPPLWSRDHDADIPQSSSQDVRSALRVLDAAAIKEELSRVSDFCAWLESLATLEGHSGVLCAVVDLAHRCTILDFTEQQLKLLMWMHTDSCCAILGSFIHAKNDDLDMNAYTSAIRVVSVFLQMRDLLLARGCVSRLAAIDTVAAYKGFVSELIAAAGPASCDQLADGDILIPTFFETRAGRIALRTFLTRWAEHIQI
jgi:hypothetical protein